MLVIDTSAACRHLHSKARNPRTGSQRLGCTILAGRGFFMRVLTRRLRAHHPADIVVDNCAICRNHIMDLCTLQLDSCFHTFVAFKAGACVRARAWAVGRCKARTILLPLEQALVLVQPVLRAVHTAAVSMCCVHRAAASRQSRVHWQHTLHNTAILANSSCNPCHTIMHKEEQSTHDSAKTTHLRGLLACYIRLDEEIT